MRATDLVRQVLDIIDQIEDKKDIEATVTVAQNDEETSHFKQILAMLDADSFGTYSNSPNEIVAPISAVTTDVGGGPNAPKHPHDIRVKDPSMYPNQQGF